MEPRAHTISHSRSQSMVNFAWSYASVAHKDQVRKYTGEPYVNHCTEVAELVATVTDDCNMICAAFLHDVLEDTTISRAELLNPQLGFRFPIVDLVVELTKPKWNGTRSQRAFYEEHRLRMISDNAQTIKLADIYCNCKNIVDRDPEFSKVYLPEKLMHLKVLQQGEYKLWSKAWDVVYDGIRRLEND